jgi:hypothetical protein
MQEKVREYSHRAFKLEHSHRDATSQMQQLQAGGISTPKGDAGGRPAQREADLISQMKQEEDKFLAQIAELSTELDAAKTENLTLCLEAKDIGEILQRTSQQVRFPASCAST